MCYDESKHKQILMDLLIYCIKTGYNLDLEFRSDNYLNPIYEIWINLTDTIIITAEEYFKLMTEAINLVKEEYGISD